ncbi:MAG: fibronectin type III domain-containing protein, partial [Clostridia bacterium]|nr:fibronectin type III domain-containing protein [Clostridia bacterium]
MINSISKRVIPMFLVLLVAVATLALTASAATTEEERGGAYGYIIPTDSNLSAQKSSYTFYGNSTKLYFMIFSAGKENSYFNIEIYSTNDYNPDNIVSSYTYNYPSDKGSVPLELSWAFKSNPSGTYYGRCYTSISDGEDQIIDKSTICKFTININRLGKETVSLTSVSNTNSGVVVKWTGLSTAVKYKVYRKANNDTKWTTLASVKAGTTAYTDKNVKSGVKYTYTVKAFDNLYASLYEKAGLTTVYLTTPKLTTPSASTSVNPVIKWSKVEG